VDPGSQGVFTIEYLISPKGVISIILGSEPDVVKKGSRACFFFFCKVTLFTHELEQVTDRSRDPLRTGPGMENSVGGF
jgi:hypothetical protein